MQTKREGEIAKKLDSYLKHNGIERTWFARRIQTAHNTLMGFLYRDGKMPKKCWAKIEIATKGEIKLKDFLTALEEDLIEQEAQSYKKGM